MLDERENMQQIIDGKLYDTKTADLVAYDPFPGHRGDRSAFLYKTKNGAFFLHSTSVWRGESDSIEVVSVDKAREWYERLPKLKMGFKEAFDTARGEA